jgi:type VI secretion system secreted protein VgrG
MVWHFNPLELIKFSFKKTNKIKLPLSKSEFVNLVYEEAKKEQEMSGVPAGVTTAQAILETGYGKAVPTDIETGRYSYNLFGIKAHGAANFVTVWTHEEINGSRVRIKDKFMAYDSFEDSIRGRTSFFVKNKRYSSLFESKDSERWANGLQEKGYATDSKYAEKLINIINQWNLK